VLRKRPRPAGSAATRPDRFVSTYLAAYRRHTLVFVFLVLLGTIGGTAAGLAVPPQYAATASVLVTPTGVTDPNPGRNRAPAAVDLDTEVQLARSPAVISGASSAISVGAAQLRNHLSLSVPANSRVLRFRFSAATPREAARGANATADAYLAQRRTAAENVLASKASRKSDQVEQLEDQLRAATDRLADPSADAGDLLYTQSEVQLLTRQISSASQRLQEMRLAVITPGRTLVSAQPPKASSRPSPARHGLEGLMLGLLCACAVTFVLGLRQRRVHGLAELGALLPPGAVACGGAAGLLGHRPRDLVANLVRTLPDGGVLSVFGIDGQPSLPVCSGPARAVQRSRYRAVVAVWPRLRMTEPGPDGGAGVAEILLSPGAEPFALATEREGVWLISAGLDVRRAAAVTGRQGLLTVLERFRAQVDYSFVQLSGPRPEETSVARMSDGVLLVARDQVTTVGELRRMIERVGPDRLVGVHLLPAPGLDLVTTFRPGRPARAGTSSPP